MFLDTYKNLVKYLQRVSLDVSFNWRYLYQDVGKTYLEIEITKMRSYWKYSKATICKYMKKKIGDLVVIEELRRRQIFSKKNLRQTKCLQEEMGKFFVKKSDALVKGGISQSFIEETVGTVLQKTDLKWNHFQRKEILTKIDLKLYKFL